MGETILFLPVIFSETCLSEGLMTKNRERIDCGLLLVCRVNENRSFAFITNTVNFNIAKPNPNR